MRRWCGYSVRWKIFVDAGRTWLGTLSSWSTNYGVGINSGKTELVLSSRKYKVEIFKLQGWGLSNKSSVTVQPLISCGWRPLAEDLNSMSRADIKAIHRFIIGLKWLLVLIPRPSPFLYLSYYPLPFRTLYTDWTRPPCTVLVSIDKCTSSNVNIIHNPYPMTTKAMMWFTASKAINRSKATLRFIAVHLSTQLIGHFNSIVTTRLTLSMTLAMSDKT